MSRLQSRAQREAAFAKLATDLHTQLEDWYDQHPAASFGEIEQEACRLRREFMGQGLAVVINGRGTGFQVEAPECPQCGESMQFVGYRPGRVSSLKGETELEWAYYVCRGCEKQTLFPPDQQLNLQVDQWSEGAARVATRARDIARPSRRDHDALVTLSRPITKPGYGTPIPSRRISMPSACGVDWITARR